jgi:hypothetical protein
MAVTSSLTLSKDPRRMAWRVMINYCALRHPEHART